MATTALEYFRQRTPYTDTDLSDADFDAFVQGIIDAGELSPTVWGDKYVLALALLVAHYYTMEQQSPGAAGPVTAERAGEVSINYGFLSNWNGDALLATKYGQQFYRLRKQVVGTRLFTTGMTASEIESG